tara:strand:+ start:105384 stop:105767 length:384 start_codon:yes stop_codon:yes gene_type:complete
MPQLRRHFPVFAAHLYIIKKNARGNIMLKSLRSKPVVIALVGVLTVTTAALAAIRVAPKAITDSVTIHADQPKGEVILSYQDGSIAMNKNCGSFPCRIDISRLQKGEYDVMIRNGTDIQNMVSLYKE